MNNKEKIKKVHGVEYLYAVRDAFRKAEADKDKKIADKEKIKKGSEIVCDCGYSWISRKDLKERKLKRIVCGMCGCPIDAIPRYKVFLSTKHRKKKTKFVHANNEEEAIKIALEEKSESWGVDYIERA